jgi:adenylate cyclase
VRYRLALALFAWLCGLAVAMSAAGGYRDDVEGYAERFRQRFSRGRAPDPQIVLAGIDDAAMTPEYFNRAVHAQVLRNLADCGARLVFFDVVFDEDRGPEVDGPLLASLLTAPATVLAGSSAQVETEDGAYAVRPPILAPDLAPALKSGHVVLGSIEKAPDVAGTVWPYILGLDFDGLRVPSAALALASLYQSVNPKDIRYSQSAVEVPPIKIPVTVPASIQGEQQLYIFDLKFHRPATGPGHHPGPGTYRVIPYLDLLQPSQELKNSLANRVVVIGENTSSETDVIDTPVGPMKGFEAHAQCFDRLLHRDFYSSAGRSQNLAAIGAMTGCVAVLALLTWPLLWLLAAGPTIIAAYLAFNMWLFDVQHLILDLGGPVLGASAALASLLLVRLLLASRFLKRFIPTEAARGILLAKQTAQATEATVIVTDIRGYTSLSETRTPVEMLHLLNEYHSVTVDIYHRHGGNVLTFQGDAQLVVFGYPRKLADAAGAAVVACVEVMKAIDDLRAKWGIKERKSFDVGAGLTTGLVYVGDIGSREQANYTVIGEVVRTSHKVQSMSDTLGGNVLLDESAYLACRVKPHTTAIPDVMLDGFPEPKVLYRVESEPSAQPTATEDQ